MKKILLLILLLPFLHCGLLQELEGINEKQKEILINSLKYGKEYDLSLTLAAIAWQESGFGKRVKNSKDGKYGSFCTYQILVQTAAKRNNLDIKLVKDKLLNDFEFCKNNAIEELLYWKNRWKGDYPKMIASYNAGYKSLNNPNGMKYYRAIAYKVLALDKYIKKYKIEY